MSWLGDRLDLAQFDRKYLRKAFPVHHSFYLGEIALSAFATLVATGIYLSVSYEGSDRLVAGPSGQVPAAYASILYIDGLPFGRLVRSVHHWSSHAMVAAAFLHLLRVLVTGAYKKPREVNWMVGLALLGLTIGASFTGYALPDDAFSVTATDIGFGIASSIPWAGPWMAELFFGGHYPTEHSLPRLLSLHITWLPMSLMALVGLHLLILVKQKHTQPAYARRLAPGSILGVPLVPQQALMMGVVLLTYLSIVFALGGAYQAHPAEVFGPPQAKTPEVKPDWYFLSLYGILQIIPSSWKLHVLGADFGPEFFGALLPPTLMLAAMVALPLLDRRRERQHYAELPSAHPLRTGATLGLVTFFGMAALGGFHQQLGLSAGLMWALLVLVPIATTLVVRQALAWALRRSQGRPAGP